jgi:dipeptidyl aminopeptidase/acylaminoacyl peptidase
VLGGADKIAVVANNELWLMNVDGTDPKQLTTDGATKNDLQWLPDGKTLLFLSGKTIKYYDISTDIVDTLTSFPSAVSLDAFQVSHDGKQVMIAMSNEMFIVPFDFERFREFNSRSDLMAMTDACILPTPGTKAAFLVKEARWAADDKLVSWLYKGVAGDTFVAADQIIIFDVTACDPTKIVVKDNFPGDRFVPVGYQSRILPDFDWDGHDLFSFNTSRRNDGWGEFYIYNWINHKPTLLYPVNNSCCYRDARWSPDGTYILFAFQDLSLGPAAPNLLYYVPVGELETGANFQPLPLPEGFFKNPKEAPQPALHPAAPPPR